MHNFRIADMLVTQLIELVDRGCQRRRLAGAGRAGDEHDPVSLPRNLGELLGKTQLFDSRDPTGDDSQNDAERAALSEDVDAKPSLAR